MTQSWIDTRNQPLRARSWKESWPRNIRQFEATEIAAVPIASDPPGEGGAGHGVDLRSRLVYGGGLLLGPLTPQDRSDLIAAGFGALITTFPDDFTGANGPVPQFEAEHGAIGITQAFPYGVNATGVALNAGSTDRSGGVTFTTAANLAANATVAFVQFAVPLDAAPVTVTITPGADAPSQAAGMFLAAKSNSAIYLGLATPAAAATALNFTYTTSLP